MGLINFAHGEVVMVGAMLALSALTALLGWGVPLAKMPGGKEFEARFVAKYQPIQLYAPYCYDAVNVMIAAMQKANSVEPAKYLPELAKISHDGVTAKIQFDEKGDLKGGAITLYQVQQGKWQPLETLGASSAAAQ